MTEEEVMRANLSRLNPVEVRNLKTPRQVEDLIVKIDLALATLELELRRPHQDRGWKPRARFARARIRAVRQAAQNRLGELNREARRREQHRLECLFMGHAYRLLPVEIFNEIKQAAKEEMDHVRKSERDGCADS